MKKLLSFVLAFVFFYSIIGFYLNFTIERYRLKEEIKEKIISSLPENELIQLKLSSVENKKLIWMEEGKEFRYNGNMYDVVKIKRSSGITFYFCFNDEKESKILTNLEKLVKDQTDSSPSRTTHKKHTITYFFQSLLFTQCLTVTPVLFFDSPTRYKSVTSDILSPPPRIPEFV
jgi:hypothetical protein